MLESSDGRTCRERRHRLTCASLDLEAGPLVPLSGERGRCSCARPGARVRRTAAVLVVDEDPRVRAALSSLLAGLDELEVVAIGPSEAGRLTEALVRDYEVGVVDVSDRSPQSLGLLRRLGAAVPVVAMSMSGSMRLPALRAGAAAFVEKDGDGEAIHRAVATVRAARREEPGT